MSYNLIIKVFQYRFNCFICLLLHDYSNYFIVHDVLNLHTICADHLINLLEDTWEHDLGLRLFFKSDKSIKIKRV